MRNTNKDRIVVAKAAVLYQSFIIIIATIIIIGTATDGYICYPLHHQQNVRIIPPSFLKITTLHKGSVYVDFPSGTRSASSKFQSNPSSDVAVLLIAECIFPYFF
jgi:hypothetical protein